jgi:hypothetical protein
MELPIISGNYTVKIHIVLSEGACFIEAAKFYYSSSDDFILRNAKYVFLLQSFNSINYSKSHADGKGGWHCN